MLILCHYSPCAYDTLGFMTGRDESIGKSFKTVEDGINAVLDRFDCFDVDRMVVLKIADRLVTLDPKISKEGQHLIPSNW